MQRYLSLFVAEAGEHLSSYAKDLLRVEESSSRGGGDARSAIDSCFRHAHSVKGMSASMRLEGISTLAHRVEDLVAVFRRDMTRLDAHAIDLLLAAGDTLQDLVQAAARGEKPPADPAMMEKLAEATRRLESGEAAQDEPEPPASAGEGAAEGGAEEPEGGGTDPAKRTVHRVQADVEIAGSCPVPAVRAYLVVKKLGALGTLVMAQPSVSELKAGRIPGKKLQVHIDTPETLQTVERALAQISDIAGVALHEAEGERAPAAERAAPARDEREREAGGEATRTVRVRTEVLDGFLDAVGELILATARIREVGKSVPAAHRGAFDEGVDRFHVIVKDLHDKVMRARMTPLALVTERLPRAARDVARRFGKEIEVEVTGAEIEIDRAILEEISDALLHLVRNAVDHGIEPPHLRQLAGKPPTGRIKVHARRERDRVILEIADDGKGMDPAHIRAAAVAHGAITAEQAQALPDREALLLACLPGVSTAATVTDVSGRGVGLDAVKRTVEAVGGTIEVESTANAGSRFTLRLPLTVAVQPVLLVRVGEEVLGLPIAKVHGAAQVRMSHLDRSQGAPVLSYEGELVPVHDLGHLLGFEPDGGDEHAVVVAEGGEGRVGLAVDGLLGQQEAVLKPLGAPLETVAGLSAVTVLGNGRPVFILDVQRLLTA